MSKAPISIQGYALNQPLSRLAQNPIVAKRAPLTTDSGQLGQIWVYPAVNGVWILSSVIANVATWVDVGESGTGMFSALTVTPGPTSLTGSFTVIAGTNTVHLGDDAADHSTIVGSVTGTSATTIQGGSGGIGISPAAAANINLNADTTGTITLGKTTTTGTIFIGIGTGGQTIAINNGIQTNTNTVNISSGANTTALTSVNIANGNMTNSGTVSILSATPTGGTQTLNLGAQTTRAIAINIGNGTGAATVGIGGTGANVISIGNTQTAGSISVGGAMTTGTLTLGGTGLTTPVAVNSAIVSATNGLQLTQGTAVARVLVGSGAPNNAVGANIGDLYINTSASTTTTRLYIFDNAGAWTYFTSNA